MKAKYTFILLLSMSFTLMFSQQKFHIHEDVVKPSMTAEYEAVLAEFNKLTKEHPIEDFNMMVFQGSDNHYFYISPIESHADLDKPSPIAMLAEKAGKDKVYALFDRMDKCYDTERDYVLVLDNDLSYMPDGMTLTPEGQNYREHYKIYVSPGNRNEVQEKMAAVRKMFADNQSKMHYRVYKSGFGTEAEFYLVSVAAADELDMAQKAKANRELMGDDGQSMMFEMFQTTLNIVETEGFMRPELAVTSN